MGSPKRQDRIEIGRIGIDVSEIKDDLKVITFSLGDSVFGVDVTQVSEVYTTKQVTSVPKAPEHVVGVANLRGQIITIIDLKSRLDLGHTEIDFENPVEQNILIVEIGDKKLGMSVDDVASVLTIPLSKIETKIDLVSHIKAQFLRGIGKISEEELIVLLNLNAILSEYEIDELSMMQKSFSEQGSGYERDIEEIKLSEEELQRLDMINVEEDIDKVVSTTKDSKKKATTKDSKKKT
ncbi:MAG: chemotaxis protein CheW [Candidatus Odinarchaeota archaeon]